MPATIVDLGKKIKAKYPGQYDDITDAELGKRIKSKFPGAYDDFVDAPAQRNAGQKALDYAADTVSNIPGSAAKLLGNVGTAVMHPKDTLKAIGSIPVGIAEKMGVPVPKPGPGETDAAQNLDAMWDSLKQRYGSPAKFAETLRTDPVGVASDVSALVGGVSGLAKGTATAADLANVPRMANAATKVAKTATTVSDYTNPMNAITKPAGYVTKAVGKGLIRSALPGLGGRAERYGATPATAALEQTTGITPKAVQSSASERLAELGDDLTAKARAADASGVNLDLTGARDAANKGIAETQRGNGLVDDLTPMRTQLNTPRPGFGGATEYPQGANTPITYNTPPPSPIIGAPPPAPTVIPGPSPYPVISARQTPTDFLPIKRQFGDDFTKFDAAVPLKNSARSLGNKVYRELSSEFNAKVPGAAPINQNIQSLIPVRDAAQRAAERAGTVEKWVDRATRPTGGLAATLMGYHAGGPLGAAAATIAQEGLSSPAARIAAARAAYGTGNALNSPITSRVFNTAGVVGSLPRYAKGGIIRKPTVGIVGEEGPEAIVPLGAPPKRKAVPPPSVKLKPRRSPKQIAAIAESMRHHKSNTPPPVNIR